MGLESGSNLWIGFIWLRIVSVARSCYHDSEPAGSVKGGQFLD